MATLRDEQAEDRRLLRELAKSNDPHLAAHAEKMLLRTRIPMYLVLEKIPGETWVAKARSVGVSRQTLHYWLHGVTRPNKKWAKKIAALIDGAYSADEIRGHAA